MISIRENVFETNSSSSHSVSVAEKTGTYTTIVPNRKKEIVLTGGQFGWEEVEYYDALTKANYCAVQAMLETDLTFKHLLEKVICKHTGAKKVKFDIDLRGSGDLSNWSYIDHQSYGVGHFDSEEQLKEFIFNPESCLHTGNDNGSYDDDYYEE